MSFCIHPNKLLESTQDFIKIIIDEIPSDKKESYKNIINRLLRYSDKITKVKSYTIKDVGIAFENRQYLTKTQIKLGNFTSTPSNSQVLNSYKQFKNHYYNKIIQQILFDTQKGGSKEAKGIAATVGIIIGNVTGFFFICKVLLILGFIVASPYLIYKAVKNSKVEYFLQLLNEKNNEYSAILKFILLTGLTNTKELDFKKTTQADFKKFIITYKWPKDENYKDLTVFISVFLSLTLLCVQIHGENCDAHLLKYLDWIHLFAFSGPSTSQMTNEIEYLAQISCNNKPIYDEKFLHLYYDKLLEKINQFEKKISSRPKHFISDFNELGPAIIKIRDLLHKSHIIFLSQYPPKVKTPIQIKTQKIIMEVPKKKRGRKPKKALN
jgi:hypothetical protein